MSTPRELRAEAKTTRLESQMADSIQITTDDLVTILDELRDTAKSNQDADLDRIVQDLSLQLRIRRS